MKYPQNGNTQLEIRSISAICRSAVSPNAINPPKAGELRSAAESDSMAK